MGITGNGNDITQRVASRTPNICGTNGIEIRTRVDLGAIPGKSRGIERDLEFIHALLDGTATS